MGKAIVPPDLPDVEGQTYSNGYMVGTTLYIAGQTAADGHGGVAGVGDATRQAERVYERIDQIVRAAGGVPEDIVMMRSYLTDMRHMPEIRDARARFFKGHKPASTSVQVVALARPEYLLEVDAVAVIGQSKG